ncbi:hypothetical protein [Taklimakanibacter deserti]|uniref:hypothetical protein n=1 Tax=Taklimakanibacter deserti TaxID=2267839 RepID=UPI000E651932
MTGDIEAEGERFLKEFSTGDAAARSALRPKGQELAQRIHSAAVHLGMAKATEFSPHIPRLFLLAAKIAFLAFGAGAPELEPFERDVRYYANFHPPDPIVAAYDAFTRTTP